MRSWCSFTDVSAQLRFGTVANVVLLARSRYVTRSDALHVTKNTAEKGDRFCMQYLQCVLIINVYVYAVSITSVNMTFVQALGWDELMASCHRLSG